MRYRTLTVAAALVTLLGTAGPVLADGDWGRHRRHDRWHHHDRDRHHRHSSHWDRHHDDHHGGWRRSYYYDGRDCDVRPYWGGAWGGRRW